jgi:S1-C subfamily serine protease
MRINSPLLKSTIAILLLATLVFTGQSQAQVDFGSQRSLNREEQANVNVFKVASPSVVNISTQRAIAARRGDVTLNIGRMPAGTGSGFIWDSSGHIVTNYHVVEDSDFVRVKLTDGTEWEAEILGTAPEFDVAVLKIEAPSNQLKPLAVGRSDNLEVGQNVYAIGNPFGLDQTLTTGIVSGLGREIDSRSGNSIRGVVQTDAAINPGNSGGPLLDSQGRLIGVNTAILSRSGASAGVGFAVPVNTVRATVPLLIDGQMVDRGYLGIALAPMQISRQATDEGVLILGIAEDSPASESGIRATRRDDEGEILWGDVVVSLQGERVADSESLLVKLQEYHAGDEVTLGLKRGDEFVRLPIRLGSRPKQDM